MIPVSGKGGTDLLKRSNWPFEKRMEVLIFSNNCSKLTKILP